MGSLTKHVAKLSDAHFFLQEDIPREQQRIPAPTAFKTLVFSWTIESLPNLELSCFRKWSQTS